MKKSIAVLILALVCSFGVQAKHLIVYSTWSTHTQTVANALHDVIGGGMVQVQVSTPYSATTDAQLYPIAQQEIANIDKNGIYPSISTTVDDIASIDTVFVGYPLWYSRMSTPMQSFLHTYGSRLAGKVIALFCSSASSAIDATVSDAKRLCPNSTFTQPLWVKASEVPQASQKVNSWLQTIGYFTATSAKIIANNSQISISATQSLLTIHGTFSSFRIFSAKGSLVLSGTSPSVAISQLPQGIYIVNLSTPSGIVNRKFIK